MREPMKKFYLFLVLLIGVITISMQIPFLLSDPDINISESTDANTDEGLNTCQIRNFVNHGDLTFNKSDNFVKTPLFGAILFLPFKAFGTKLLVARLTVLLLSISICFFIYNFNLYYRLFGLLSIVFVFSEFFVFHYFHYSMAEMLSTVLLFFSIFLLVKPHKLHTPLKASLLSATFISLAYYIKIQFLYDVLILPLIITFFIVFKLYDKKLLIKQLTYTIAFLAMYMFIYFVLWYLPNKSFFNYVMADQTTNRFFSFPHLVRGIAGNIFYSFYTDYLRFFMFSFIGLYIIGIYKFTTKSLVFKALFIGVSCWILVESHKLSMTYLPIRYLISLIFPMGLIMALVVNELMLMKEKNGTVRLLKVFSIVILSITGIKNFVDYSISYKNRTYSILTIDKYLSKFNFGNETVIGAWAPSLSWQSKAISYPVWKGYFNDVDVIKEQNPAIIIAETDEEDSNQAFSSRGIVIDAYADSIKYFTVNHWEIKLLWIKKSTFNTP